MAFPLPTVLPKDFDSSWSNKATELKELRKVLIKVLFIEPPIDKNDTTARQLDRIAQTLSRTASNEPTAYENGSVPSTASSVQSTLTRQVERALTQVLGRSPGRGTDGFMKALNSAFPVGVDGKVLLTPSRSTVSNQASDAIASTNGKAVTGQLSVEQANLYRQASILITDALRVLEGFESYDPSADIDAVEALRSLAQAQLTSLMEEFGRLDEPRPARVNIYFNTLDRTLDQLGEAAHLSSNSSFNNLVTTEDEAQVAAYELVKNYVKTLKGVWSTFTGKSEAETISTGFSERLSRVNVMLPVVADSNASLMAAMDSIGFTESERRSDAALFSTLGTDPIVLQAPISTGGETLTSGTATDNSSFSLSSSLSNEEIQLLRRLIGTSEPLSIELPDITVNDFSEWVDRFTSVEAPSILAASGRFGLEFVTDQADTLFWVIGLVLLYLKDPTKTAKGRMLGRILAFDRVEQCLNELIFQLNALADLGVQESSRFI